MAQAQRREKLFYGAQRDIQHWSGLPGDLTLANWMRYQFPTDNHRVRLGS